VGSYGIVFLNDVWQGIAVGVVGICAALAIVKWDDHVLTFGSRFLLFQL